MISISVATPRPRKKPAVSRREIRKFSLNEGTHRVSRAIQQRDSFSRAARSWQTQGSPRATPARVRARVPPPSDAPLRSFTCRRKWLFRRPRTRRGSPLWKKDSFVKYYIEREKEFALVGSLYKGRVTRVLPGMQSAFVEIGLDSDAFLYVSDFLEETEELDHIVTTVEEKVAEDGGAGRTRLCSGHPAAPALEPADVEATPLDSSPSVSSETAEPAAAYQPAAIPVAPVNPTQPSSRPPDRPRFDNRGRQGRDSGRRSPAVADVSRQAGRWWWRTRWRAAF